MSLSSPPSLLLSENQRENILRRGQHKGRGAEGGALSGRDRRELRGVQWAQRAHSRLTPQPRSRVLVSASATELAATCPFEGGLACPTQDNSVAASRLEARPRGRAGVTPRGTLSEV